MSVLTCKGSHERVDLQEISLKHIYCTATHRFIYLILHEPFAVYRECESSICSVGCTSSCIHINYIDIDCLVLTFFKSCIFLIA